MFDGSPKIFSPEDVKDRIPQALTVLEILGLSFWKNYLRRDFESSLPQQIRDLHKTFPTKLKIKHYPTLNEGLESENSRRDRVDSLFCSNKVHLAKSLQRIAGVIPGVKREEKCTRDGISLACF